jgi:hypothetical protein
MPRYFSHSCWVAHGSCVLDAHACVLLLWLEVLLAGLCDSGIVQDLFMLSIELFPCCGPQCMCSQMHA